MGEGSAQPAVTWESFSIPAATRGKASPNPQFHWGERFSTSSETGESLDQLAAPRGRALLHQQMQLHGGERFYARSPTGERLPNPQFHGEESFYTSCYTGGASPN